MLGSKSLVIHEFIVLGLGLGFERVALGIPVDGVGLGHGGDARSIAWFEQFV